MVGVHNVYTTVQQDAFCLMATAALSVQLVYRPWQCVFCSSSQRVYVLIAQMCTVRRGVGTCESRAQPLEYD